MALSETLNKEILIRLSKWAIEGTAPPVRMVVLPTNRCNLRCVFCGGVYEREGPNFTYKDEMSTERWLQIVEEGTKFGVLEWLIGGGGEPLIRADTLIEIIKKIKKGNPNSMIELSTNGTLITPTIAEGLVSAGCDFIQIGIDGPDAKTHNFLRGKEIAFERSCEGIKLLALYKKKLKKEKPIIKIHVVLNSKNYDKLPEMVSLGHSLGANFFAVAAMRVYGGGQKTAVDKATLRMTEEQKKKTHEVWKKVEKIAAEKNIQLGPAFYEGLEEVSEVVEYKPDEKIPQYTELPKDSIDYEHDRIQQHTTERSQEDESFKTIKNLQSDKVSHSTLHQKQVTPTKDDEINRFLSAFCFAPFYGLIVDWAGNVGPCPCAGSVKDTGNNLKTKSLEEVWYGKFLNDVRGHMLEGKPIKLEDILVGQDVRGTPQHPCESCGINIERYEMVQRLAPIIKNRKVQ